jgi:hypothetical protein
MENMPYVEQESPNISPGDLMKELGNRWNELTDLQRTHYKNKYDEKEI